jgi:hypothetical protein
LRTELAQCPIAARPGTSYHAANQSSTQVYPGTVRNQEREAGLQPLMFI